GVHCLPDRRDEYADRLPLFALLSAECLVSHRRISPTVAAVSHRRCTSGETAQAGRRAAGRRLAPRRGAAPVRDAAIAAASRTLFPTPPDPTAPEAADA